MSLNPLRQKPKLVKRPITITDDVYDLIMDITKPSQVSINSPKEEFVSNHVKQQLRDQLSSIKDKGYYLVRA